MWRFKGGLGEGEWEGGRTGAFDQKKDTGH